MIKLISKQATKPIAKTKPMYEMQPLEVCVSLSVTTAQATLLCGQRTATTLKSWTLQIQAQTVVGYINPT